MLKQFITLTVLFGSFAIATPAIAQVQITEEKAKVALAGTNPIQLIAVGVDQLSRMNYAEAESIFWKAIKQAKVQGDPGAEDFARLQLFTARKLGGSHLLRSGQPSAAIPVLELASGMQSDDAFVHQQLAKAYAEVGNTHASKISIDLALQYAEGPAQKQVMQTTKEFLLSKS